MSQNSITNAVSNLLNVLRMLFTQISADTTDMLLEVTSTVSLEKCKVVMQALLEEMLQLGIGE